MKWNSVCGHACINNLCMEKAEHAAENTALKFSLTDYLELE